MKESDNGRKISRRKFLGTVGGLSMALGLTGMGWLTSFQSLSALANESGSLRSILQQTQAELNQTQTRLEEAKNELNRVSRRWVAYGAGSNIKYMPDPLTRQPTVPLEEIWGFDTTFAFCRVENNPRAFVMPTYTMGEVTIDAGSFFMLMLSRVMSDSNLIETSTGGAKVVLKGGLDCYTEAESANVRLGSRTVGEPAEFEVEAIDERGLDSFAFTAYFDRERAPLNNAIFGPKATFTGEIKTGEVVIRRFDNLKTIEF